MVLKTCTSLMFASLCLIGTAHADPLTAQPVSVSQFAAPQFSASVRASAYMPKTAMRPTLSATVPNWPAPEAQTARLSQGVLSRTFEPEQAFDILSDMRRFDLGALRLKLDVFVHMDDRGTIDAAYLNALESVIAQAARAQVPVILTEDNSAPCSKLPEACAPLLQSIWAQLSTRFQAATPDLMFELLSDPQEHLTADRWNALQAKLITTIRTHNPSRILIVTPSTRADVAGLDSLSLPQEDRHLIVAVRFDDLAAHEVEPNAALLKIKAVRDVEEASYAKVDANLNTLSQWARLNERPLFLKEIGSQDPEAVKYRTRWVANLVKLASQKGLGWGLGDATSVLKPEAIQQARKESGDAQMNAGLSHNLSAN